MKDSCTPLNRRSFLKTGAAGAAAWALSSMAKAQTGEPACRPLGKTGMSLSVIGIGALLTAEAAVFQAAFDMGVNHVDTARGYMNGQNESIVGEALKGYRDKVFVSTKIFPTNKEKMKQDIDASLTALGVDYVDLLQMHKLDDPGQVTNEEFRSVMLETKQAGKARHLGISTHKNMEAVIDAIIQDPDHLFETVLTTYNFKSRPELGEAIDRAAKAGIGIVAMKTQAGGYESGATGDVTPHQAALKWVLSNPNITAAVPSMVDVAQLRENTAVMGMPLTTADAAALERYGQTIEARYCRACGACTGLCPAGVDIPEINRCVMYAEGYQNLALARSAYGELPREAALTACGSCETCIARCAYGLSIPERIEKARLLFA